jgi:hypothetical protein
MVDLRFIGSDIDPNEFEPIILSRCFNGWKDIKDKFHRPGRDGDIILFIPKRFKGDIQDAKIIIEYLYKCAQKDVPCPACGHGKMKEIEGEDDEYKCPYCNHYLELR